MDLLKSDILQQCKIARAFLRNFEIDSKLSCAYFHNWFSTIHLLYNASNYLANLKHHRCCCQVCIWFLMCLSFPSCVVIKKYLLIAFSLHLFFSAISYIDKFKRCRLSSLCMFDVVLVRKSRRFFRTKR